MHKSGLLVFIIFFFCFVFCEDPLEKLWTAAYTNGSLNFKETRSGMGASLDYTAEIRSKLPKILKKYKIRSVLDIGCGDFNWMNQILPKDISYIGVDIIKAVIDENKANYSSENCTFVHLDARKSELPKADLVICRDVLAHLSFLEAFNLLYKIQGSKSTYILLTTYDGPVRCNTNLSSSSLGNYLINMQRDPFLFPSPLEIFNEGYSEYVTPDKSFAIWKIENMPLEIRSGVTYLDDAHWGGRLGDKLLMYVKAKWISYIYHIPFFYKPFKYSDELMMHELDMHWMQEKEKEYLKVDDPYVPGVDSDVLFGYEMKKSVNLSFFVQPVSSKLHIINYFFNPDEWGDYQKKYNAQDVSSWKGLIDDQQFREELRKTIAPRYEMKYLEIPEDRISVAVHVRKGGGFDGDLLSLQLLHAGVPKVGNIYCYCSAHKDTFTDKAYTVKFPPDQFYVDQIRKMSEFYNDAPMYVHIFTDDLKPESIAERYEAALNKKNITFGFRKLGNSYAKNVLQDLFDMTQFDCLIRSGSNFPQIAQLIGNFKVVIYPRNAEWCNYLNIYDVGYIYP